MLLLLLLVEESSSSEGEASDSDSKTGQNDINSRTDESDQVTSRARDVRASDVIAGRAGRDGTRHRNNFDSRHRA